MSHFFRLLLIVIGVVGLCGCSGVVEPIGDSMNAFEGNPSASGKEPIADVDESGDSTVESDSDPTAKNSNELEVPFCGGAGLKHDPYLISHMFCRSTRSH